MTRLVGQATLEGCQTFRPTAQIQRRVCARMNGVNRCDATGPIRLHSAPVSGKITTIEQVCGNHEELENLPPESLSVVEQFVRFLQSHPVARPLAESSYPTIPNPASSLANWINVLPQGYASDALADTEALYGEA